MQDWAKLKKIKNQMDRATAVKSSKGSKADDLENQVASQSLNNRRSNTSQLNISGYSNQDVDVQDVTNEYDLLENENKDLQQLKAIQRQINFH